MEEEKVSLANLYVDNIPKSVSEEELRQLFAPHGTVTRCKIAIDFLTRYAFVHFETPEQAANAITALHGAKIHGQDLKVSIAKRKEKPKVQISKNLNIYVAGIPKSYSDKDLRTLFSPFGELKEVKILKDPQGQPRGIGFVRFVDKERADQAISALNNTVAPKGGETPMVVKYARERNQDVTALSAYGPVKTGSKGQNRFSPYGTPAVAVSPMGFPVAFNGFAPAGYGAGATPPYSSYPPVAMGQLGNGAGFAYAGGAPVPGMGGVPGVPGMAGMAGVPGMAGMAGMPGMPGMPDLGGVAYQIAMPNVAEYVTLFVFHIPNETTELDLANLFSLYGQVVKVNIVKDKSSSQPKGYGFVQMSNAKDAATAIQFLNGYKIGNKFLKVSIKSQKGNEQPVSAFSAFSAVPAVSSVPAYQALPLASPSSASAQSVVQASVYGMPGGYGM
jgi:RNA recognition motif-containing protein